MKRHIYLVLIFIMIFAFATNAHAITGDRNNDGLIAYQEYGEWVSMIQTRMRELGYFLFKPTGNFQSMTRNSIISFQENQVDDAGNPIIADGTVGAQTISILFSTDAVRANIPQETTIPFGERADGSQTQTGERVSWSEVATLLEQGASYELIDFNTGSTFSMTYVGGESHAEMECTSPTDTTTYKETFGGEFNYSKRPMLIDIGGRIIACSLQGEPHGDDTVSQNDMDGHACLFFYESRSHVAALPDVEHNANVNVASGS